jgi:hypothetical protein
MKTAWAVRVVAVYSVVLLTSCAYQTRGVLHSNIREPVAISDSAAVLELLGHMPPPSGGSGLSSDGPLDDKACSTNVLGWATGDASITAAYTALLNRVATEIKPAAGRHAFLTQLHVDQSYVGWFGIYSETCTYVAGIVLEIP